MTVNHSAISMRFLWHSAAAGLLVGLTIIYFWPELASWWPEDLPRIYSISYRLIGLGQTGIETLPLAVYGKLLVAGFVLAFLHPGHSKMPIVAWMLHNQPSGRDFFGWIARSWILQCGFLIIIFWRIGFMRDLPTDTLLRFVSFFNYICYFATLMLGLTLVRDAWRLVKTPEMSLSNLRLPLIFALGFYLPSQVVWLLLNAIHDYHALLGWLLFAPVMIGILLARLATGGIACMIRHWVGEAGCQKWRAHFALFNGVVLLCIVTNTFVRIGLSHLWNE
ncbi:hypothetical protein HV213_08195 [Klebsiella sp. RHBSTW-00484]|uniref:hypothetical protein n=1 Tax=unclassified Klebsiella TaxID=2608929 RepID=UPI0015E4E217|nr:MULTISPECIES: hypothetical protein [unclassified Klebsiella]QLO35810.1 hypothetical protein HV213_08195 [Klebsiella sp. RHBSTW-00484]QLT75324.1 hypothetical protein HV204_08195 [Klebsiella sp. RHBSTW-00464]